MSATKRTIECDYSKLHNELKKRGVTVREAALLMGYGATALAESKSKLGLTKPMATMLKTMFNISQDDYKPDKKEPEQPTVTDSAENVRNEPQQTFNDIREDLYDLIYKAVYEAVKKAWSE